jgi:DNA-directed RNA polymerase specialized sigma24 family protein
LEGLTAGEVAELTGDSVEAVKSRLHRARRNVQQRAMGPVPARIQRALEQALGPPSPAA